jgi:hypothetical protein
MTVFARLPQDVLQYVINPYLKHHDRLALNVVLKPDERIYRKIPKDYAIVHEIETKKTLYESMMRRLNYYMNLYDLDNKTNRERALIKAELTKKIYAFLCDPLNALLFAHVKGLKEQMIASVREDLTYEEDFHYYLPDKGAELCALAKATLAVIESRPFLRKVHFAKRVYLHL